MLCNGLVQRAVVTRSWYWACWLRPGRPTIIILHRTFELAQLNF